jgi:hypothetical protein
MGLKSMVFKFVLSKLAGKVLGGSRAYGAGRYGYSKYVYAKPHKSRGVFGTVKRLLKKLT